VNAGWRLFLDEEIEWNFTLGDPMYLTNAGMAMKIGLYG
jgi:hypothetical protein